MPYLRSPSTSARSLVIAMTVANTVTKHVMNLRGARLSLTALGFSKVLGFVRAHAHTHHVQPLHPLPGSLRAGCWGGLLRALDCSAQAGLWQSRALHLPSVASRKGGVVTAGPREAHHSTTVSATNARIPLCPTPGRASLGCWQAQPAIQAASVPPGETGRFG